MIAKLISKLGVVVLLTAGLSATPLLLTGSGTFTSNVPVTAFSGPNLSFSFSFNLDSSPTVSNVIAGGLFDPAYSNFSYSLGGSPVGFSPNEITFYSAPSNTTASGLLRLFDGSGNSLQLFGPQLYTGPESAPIILTGVFPTDPLAIPMVEDASGVKYSFYSATVTITPVGTVPEPATVWLFGIGLLALALYWKRGRTATARG